MTMATYITLVNFTDLGIRAIKDSPNRADAFRQMAQKLDITVRDVYWTAGQYDVIAVVDGPDEAVTTAVLTLGAEGNVRTQTLRAFSEAEMRKIIEKIP